MPSLLQRYNQKKARKARKAIEAAQLVATMEGAKSFEH